MCTTATDRVIVLVDMDCFYCQVEQKLDPSLVGKPLAVVQYNAWKGGGLIAVNYEARAKGVTRHMRGDEAKAKCPQIALARVPQVRGKADLTRYRDAGKQVAEVLQTFTTLLERASVDEAYLDITDSVNERLEMMLKPELLPNTHVLGFDSVADFLNEINHDRYLNDSNVKLAIGGVITEEIRAAVYEKTGYRCSAGVGHNKTLAKLTAGLHKPNKQTILPHESVPKLYENLSVKKIRSMGGKFGDEVIQKLHVTNMIDLLKFTEKELQQHFEEKTANWLYNIARGVNHDPVTVRLVSKSIGCCKRFPGRGALKTEKDVRHWTSELAVEIAERIEKDIEENNRKPKQLIVSYSQRVGKKDVSSTRSHQLNTVEQERIYQEAYEIIKKNCQQQDGRFVVTFLGLNVSKFEDIKNVTEITSFFKSAPKRASIGSETINDKKRSEVNDELNDLSNELYKIVQDNIKVQSLGQTSKTTQDFHLTSTDSNKVRLETVKTKSEVKVVSNVNEIDNGDDDSEAELEAINSSAASVNDANTSICSLARKGSFFCNFLKRENAPKRDFNTSVILDEVDESNDTGFGELNEEIKDNDEIIIKTNETIREAEGTRCVSPVVGSKTNEPQQKQSQNKNHTILSMFNTNSNNVSMPTTSSSYITDDNKELCTECNKLIPVENIVAHMDYHFAIKMVRDEAYLYKQDNSKTVSNVDNVSNVNDNITLNQNKRSKNEELTVNILKSNEKNKISNNNSRKRKSSGSASGTKEITSFLKGLNGNSTEGASLGEENSEMCPDCCKRIKLDDIESHSDYHVAKKLHQEINTGLSTTTNNRNQNLSDVKVINNKNCDKGNKGNSTKSSKNKTKNGGDGKAITTYFKKM